MDRYPIASVANLDLTIESSGVGVAGEAPVAIIQRQSDGYYYDGTQASGSQFASTLATNAMVEVDSANLPGLYQIQFPHSEDLTSSELFLVRYQNGGAAPLLVDETIGFGPFRSAEAPEMCTLYGTVLDISGAPGANRQVRIAVLPNTILSSGDKPGVLVGNVDVYTDTSGMFSVNLVRSLIARLQIVSIGYDRKIVVPDAASANFADL